LAPPDQSRIRRDGMSTLRWLAVGAVVCLVGGARADDKTDYAKMIVGKWEVTKADEGTVPPGTIVEFTRDGKFILAGKKDGTDQKFEGTYKVEKNTFTFSVKINDAERSQTITITKISDKEMATKNNEDKVVELTKKK
jgi:uncharacterized protein (TIGR03066 family)